MVNVNVKKASHFALQKTVDRYIPFCSYFRADIMNSKRQERGKLGHVVQIVVFQLPLT